MACWASPRSCGYGLRRDSYGVSRFRKAVSKDETPLLPDSVTSARTQSFISSSSGGIRSTLLVELPWSTSATRCSTSARRSGRSEEHTSELQSRFDIVCRLLLEKKKNNA